MDTTTHKDFWLSCGHHLLDRDAGGGLVATDEFLKVYLARPELAPPPEACAAERALHGVLLAEPRRQVSAGEIAVDRRCRRPRELAGDACVPRPSAQAPHHRSRLCRYRAARPEGAAPVHQPAGARHPAQRARRLRRPLCAARRRAVLPAAAHDPARRLADRRRRGNHLGQKRNAGLAAGLDARHSGGSRDRRDERRQRGVLFRAQRSVSCRARSHRRPARLAGARHGDRAMGQASARGRRRHRAAGRNARGEIHLVCRARCRRHENRRRAVERRGARRGDAGAR